MNRSAQPGISSTVGGVSLDTSGMVYPMEPRVQVPGGMANAVMWSDLSPFEQGYVEAMLSGVTKPFELAKVYRTRDGQAICIMQRADKPGYECVKGDDPADDHPEGGWRYNRASDRGRVTGSAFDMSDPRNLIPENAAFSDLAPETLAAIRKDCATFCESRLGGPNPYTSTDAEAGRLLWSQRQRAHIRGFPPLTPTLGDDGKVRFQ